MERKNTLKIGWPWDSKHICVFCLTEPTAGGELWKLMVFRTCEEVPYKLAEPNGHTSEYLQVKVPLYWVQVLADEAFQNGIDNSLQVFCHQRAKVWFGPGEKKVFSARMECNLISSCELMQIYEVCETFRQQQDMTESYHSQADSSAALMENERAILTLN